MSTKPKAAIDDEALKRRAARARREAPRDQERAVRAMLDRERRERGAIEAGEETIEPDDAMATARFIGGLRRERDPAGLSLGDVAERTGIDKAALSRLENGFCPNPTVNTLARYARGIGRRLALALED